MKHGRPVKTHTEASLADGLTVPKVGINAFATAGNEAMILYEIASDDVHCATGSSLGGQDGDCIRGVDRHLYFAPD